MFVLYLGGELDAGVYFNMETNDPAWAQSEC
jgi:hypothetical protein